MPRLTVVFTEQSESFSALIRRLHAIKGEVLLVFSHRSDSQLLHSSEKEKSSFITAITKMSSRVRVVTRYKKFVSLLREKGIRVIDRTQDLHALLVNHPQQEEAMRRISPQLWQQQLRSRLQAAGLLSIPRLRIWILIAVSIVLFGFVFFKLLPSAEITVTPREDIVSQTANIFLVLSGATVDIPERVRAIELVPISVSIDRALTFDQISKEFIGENSSMMMTIVNDADEMYSLRKGTRLTNQAGMVFRIQESIDIPASDSIEVNVIADSEDLYREVVGERGNVPEGLKWEIPGLPEAQRKLVYGMNHQAGVGGITAYETVLKQRDLAAAEQQLKSELLAEASNTVDEQILLYNQRHPEEVLTRLYYDELTAFTFTGFTMPTAFLGEKVASIPVEGSLEFTAYGYDAHYILSMLFDELGAHTTTGKKLIPESVTLSRLVVHVIDYADALEWIKLTVDLSGIEQSILDPLTPTGARFAKEAREAVLGKTVQEARRIIRNFQEVEQVSVSLWPPWNSRLPSIAFHITITVEE